MKKQLNVDMIQSELRGGSAFFPGYKPSHSPAPSEQLLDNQSSSSSAIDLPQKDINSLVPKPRVNKPHKLIESSDMQGVPPPVPCTVPRTEPLKDVLVPKVKRSMKQRQPFDIYEDQYTQLKQIADSERGFVNGRGMSQMVREAIDAYLTARSSSDKK